MSRRFFSPNSTRKTPSQRNQCRLQLEELEDRTVPSGNTISGYVFHDLNNNGLKEAGEQGISGVTLELLDANGQPTGSPLCSMGRYSRWISGAVS